ncbi:hypothetical protein ACSDR0_46295 [Streptosporangium sp. G11]|uniref:hypothetical protein n=1 Tax=Streptosporangium sp. G11 TaxID=3436926 RepID=UPI003EBAD8A1
MLPSHQRTVWANSHPGRLLIEASLWSADLGALAAEVDRMQPHADLFHLDASDSRFVPEPLFFPALLAQLKPRTPVPFHVHLMARDPVTHIGRWIEAGADLISVHLETADVRHALTMIRDQGKAAGLALRLDSDPAQILPLLDVVDVIVMVGTALGTKGTAMDPAAPRRISAVRDLLTSQPAGRTVSVLADGGIRTGTVPALAAAGADGVVAGSLLFASADPAQTAAWLHGHTGQAHPAEQ